MGLDHEEFSAYNSSGGGQVGSSSSSFSSSASSSSFLSCSLKVPFRGFSRWWINEISVASFSYAWVLSFTLQQ